MHKIDHIKIKGYQGKCKHIFFKLAKRKNYDIKVNTKRKNTTFYESKQNTSHLLTPLRPPPPQKKTHKKPKLDLKDKQKLRFLE